MAAAETEARPAPSFLWRISAVRHASDLMLRRPRHPQARRRFRGCSRRSCCSGAQLVLLARALALDAAGAGRQLAGPLDGSRRCARHLRRCHCRSGPGGRRSQLEAGYLLHRQIQQPLPLGDQAPVSFGFRRDEAHRHAAGAGPPGAADAVDIVGRSARQVVVDHGRQPGDVDAARSQIGGHHHLPALVLELLQHLPARALAQPAVEGRGVDARLVELFGDVLGAYCVATKTSTRVQPASSFSNCFSS